MNPVPPETQTRRLVSPGCEPMTAFTTARSFSRLLCVLPTVPRGAHSSIPRDELSERAARALLRPRKPLRRSRPPIHRRWPSPKASTRSFDGPRNGHRKTVPWIAWTAIFRLFYLGRGGGKGRMDGLVLDERVAGPITRGQDSVSVSAWPLHAHRRPLDRPSRGARVPRGRKSEEETSGIRRTS